jgi:YD repeat-containing protein
MSVSSGCKSFGPIYDYEYDEVDNMLTSNETGVVKTSTYDAASRLVTSLEGSVLTTYAWDDNGNLIGVNDGASLVTMVYDMENRLIRHEQAGSVATFAYDGDGLKRLELTDGADGERAAMPVQCTPIAPGLWAESKNGPPKGAVLNLNLWLPQ